MDCTEARSALLSTILLYSVAIVCHEAPVEKRTSGKRATSRGKSAILANRSQRANVVGQSHPSVGLHARGLQPRQQQGVSAQRQRSRRVKDHAIVRHRRAVLAKGALPHGREHAMITQAAKATHVLDLPLKVRLSSVTIEYPQALLADTSVAGAREDIKVKEARVHKLSGSGDRDSADTQ